MTQGLIRPTLVLRGRIRGLGHALDQYLGAGLGLVAARRTSPEIRREVDPVLEAIRDRHEPLVQAMTVALEADHRIRGAGLEIVPRERIRALARRGGTLEGLILGPAPILDPDPVPILGLGPGLVPTLRSVVGAVSRQLRAPCGFDGLEER